MGTAGCLGATWRPDKPFQRLRCIEEQTNDRRCNRQCLVGQPFQQILHPVSQRGKGVLPHHRCGALDRVHLAPQLMERRTLFLIQNSAGVRSPGTELGQSRQQLVDRAQTIRGLDREDEGQLLLILLLLDCFMLVLVVLLQAGKGGGLAAGFGGAGTGMEMMGSRQTVTFLHTATTTSDAKGRFRFEELEPGTVRIHAVREGLIPASIQVDAGREDAEIRLTPAAEAGAAPTAPSAGPDPSTGLSIPTSSRTSTGGSRRTGPSQASTPHSSPAGCARCWCTGRI